MRDYFAGAGAALAMFFVFFLVGGACWLVADLEHNMHQQTALLTTIAEQTKPPIKTSVIEVDPRVVALCRDAVKPKSNGKGSSK